MTATTGATTAVKSIGRRMENILPNKNNNVDTNDSSNKQQQQPSPDKTASLDDDLECSYDDNNDEGGEDDRDSPSQSLNRKKRQTTTTLAHKLLLRGSGARKVGMNQNNSNINNNDDIIAAAALANADKALAAQQPQLSSSSPRAIPSNNSNTSSEFGLSFNNILCNRNPSSGTIISDLSASLSPTLSRESWIAGLQQNQQQQQQFQQQQQQQQQRQYEAEQCFGGGCSNRHVHKMTRSSSFDDTGTYTAQSSRYNYNHNNRERANSSTTGGGGEGILIKAMKSCAVFRDFDTILGGNGVGGEDDDDIPPPPPPRTGGGYQRPAIWGVAPDANDTFDEESYVSATAGGGGGYTHRPFSIAQRNTTKDDGELLMKTEKDDEEEEEEYDNVELILDESKMQVSSPPRNKNNRRSKSSPQRGSKKSSMMKKSSNHPMMMRMLTLGGRNNNNNKIPTNVDDNSPPPVTIVHHDDKKNMSVGTTPTNDVVDHIANIVKSTNAPSPSPTSALDIAAVSAVLLNETSTTTTIEVSKEMKKTRSRQGRRQRRHSQKKKEEVEEKKNKSRAIVTSTPPPASPDSDPIVVLHDVATPDRQQQLQVDVKTVTRGGETHTTPVNDDEQVLDELARRPDPPEVCTPVQQQQEDLLNKTLEEEFEIDDLVISTNTSTGMMKDKKTFKSAIMLRSMKKGIHNFKLTAAPKSKSTTTTNATTTTAVISDKDIKNAKHWNAVYDRSSEKYYYYHKLTREVCWDKPVGYDEANNNNNSGGGGGGDTTNSRTKKRSGIVGLVGKKAVGTNTKQGDDTSNPDVKYWREAVDKSTNEVYYYNSKTKEVSWTRPTCLNEKGDKTSGDDNENVKVERSISPVQIMKNIIGKNVKSVDNMKNPIEEITTVVGGDTTERSNQFLTPVRGGDNNLATLAVEVVANNSNTTDDDDVRHWREATDATTGKTYYFHKLTKVVTWVKPAELKDAVPAAGAGTTVAPTTKQQTFLADDLSEEVEEDVEKVVPNEHDESNYVLPFDEDEAPFDEQPQQGSRLNKSSSSVKKVVTVTPSQFEDDDGGEQHDTFDQFSPMRNSGRSNKSTSDQLSRQRTYISHATTKSDSTKKVTNTVHNIHPSSSSTQYNRNISDAATFDSSINSNASNIVSEITAVVGSKLTNTRGGVHKDEENDIPHIPNTASRVVVAGQQATPRMSAKTSSTGTSNLIKSTTAVASAAKAGGGGGDSNRKYMSKRAENLGDSSSTNSEKDDDDELWSEDDDIDDSVSALSGIGNDSISKNTKKKKNTTNMKKRTSSSCKKTNDQSKHLPSSDSVNKWTQEELDLFISKNDWGSVAEYINEIRASKQGDITNNRNRSNNSRNKQSTIHEVEERKKNVISPAEETESIWQSLSSDDEK
jgi:hypothetical protein